MLRAVPLTASKVSKRLFQALNKIQPGLRLSSSDMPNTNKALLSRLPHKVLERPTEKFPNEVSEVRCLDISYPLSLVNLSSTRNNTPAGKPARYFLTTFGAETKGL